ncbi:DUF6470 family protein [Oceanobacillus profundus]|uniref:DUF6470 family protein n=1 Tax=Oceanobacillus TaxID=182709 RepID=UPI000BA5C4D7|nr:DUF6470 family protein [Oceanobacillus profundus]MBR3117977.1 hypothetical protein [Oceanobacillus sp.]MCM3397299.1 DUF6470 family protein [Oceanobacillus profundus]MDO6449544.1 DUF6470 family protein [Oceanobacillus profundus]PAE28579.1 hypothetical protein CHI07_12790 [Paenibacillus sp. 7884-2]
MQIPQIRMQSQQAQIEIQNTDAKLEISQPQAELNIQQPQAELSIRTTPGKLRIDQTQAWADLNLMHITERNERFAREGKNSLMHGIARRARQGDELMKIENGGDPLINQAIQNSSDPMKSLGIKFIPSHFSVKTSYQPAEVHIDVQTKKPIINATPRSPEFTYEAGNVTTSLKQRQYLKISFTNLYV